MTLAKAKQVVQDLIDLGVQVQLTQITPGDWAVTASDAANVTPQQIANFASNHGVTAVYNGATFK